MASNKIKALAVVFALILITGLVAVGCKNEPQKAEWVNTKSLPGNTFVDHSNNTKQGNSSIVYLGGSDSSSSSSSSGSFGPQDVNFEFQALR